MVYGLGYNLGGGVMLEAAYFSVEQNQGDTKDTDVDGVISKISFTLKVLDGKTFQKKSQKKSIHFIEYFNNVNKENFICSYYFIIAAY